MLSSLLRKLKKEKPRAQPVTLQKPSTKKSRLNRALYKAVKKNDLPHVNALLAQGADPNAFQKNGKTALHKAVKMSAHEIVKTLIAAGASVNLQTKKRGNTALHIATKNTDLAMLEDVLDEAKPNPDITNHKGDTPLHIACRERKEGVLEVAQSLLYVFHANPNLKNNSGMAPLHLATINNEYEIIEDLLAKGADLNMPCSRDGRTALHIASEQGALELIDDLFENADVNVKRSDTGNTPLHEAVLCGDLEALELLLSRKGDPNLANHRGETPLHLAAAANEYEMVEELLNEEADIHAVDNDGKTPLHVAATNQHLHLVDDFFGLANPNIADLKQQTPLHAAVITGDLEMVEAMLFLGGDPNLADKDGNTPLHLAVAATEWEMAEALLEEFANPFLKNNHGETAVDIAKRLGLEELANLMVNKVKSQNILEPTVETNDEIKDIKAYLRVLYSDFLNQKLETKVLLEKLSNFLHRIHNLYGDSSDMHQFANQCANYLFLLMDGKANRLPLPIHLKKEKLAFIADIDALRRTHQHKERMTELHKMMQSLRFIKEDKTPKAAVYPALQDKFFYGEETAVTENKSLYEDYLKLDTKAEILPRVEARSHYQDFLHYEEEVEQIASPGQAPNHQPSITTPPAQTAPLLDPMDKKETGTELSFKKPKATKTTTYIAKPARLFSVHSSTKEEIEEKQTTAVNTTETVTTLLQRMPSVPTEEPQATGQKAKIKRKVNG